MMKRGIALIPGLLALIFSLGLLLADGQTCYAKSKEYQVVYVKDWSTELYTNNLDINHYRAGSAYFTCKTYLRGDDYPERHSHPIKSYAIECAPVPETYGTVKAERVILGAEYEFCDSPDGACGAHLDGIRARCCDDNVCDEYADWWTPHAVYLICEEREDYY